MARFDLAVVNGTVVFPFVGTFRCDIAARGGKIAAIADSIDSREAEEVIDARGRLVFPGAVDSHFHLGIYRPLSEDVQSETRSALVGGVTSVLSYFRTGQYYLNKTGPYREIFPEVLSLSRDRAYTDYGYHLAIMTSAQVQEVDWLVKEQGIGSFKYFMFYKGLNLVGDSTETRSFTMAEAYDLGHLFELMQAVADAARKHGEHGRISLGVHCENAELLRHFITKIKREGIGGLEAWHRARPGLSERLSIAEATVLADQVGCPLNLLHLSGADALDAALQARQHYPQLDLQLEATLHHLALTTETGTGVNGKVNPPIRTQADVEALWRGVLSGQISTVVSDHACCMLEQKGEDLWSADLGFGGSSLIYPVLVSEGYHKRGLALARIAELASANPARNFGLFPRKGSIAVGTDADLAVVDPEEEARVTVDRLLSAQDHTPFEGFPIKGWPTQTVRAGRIMYSNGKVVGKPDGCFLKRPDALHTP